MSKVLVADDDRDLRGAIKMVLVSAGYEVTESRGGKKALEKVYQEHPDLILLGLTISGSDAADVLEELASNPATSEIPVILLGAEGQEAPDSPELNARGFIKRPFSPEQLESKVQLAIGRTATKTVGERPAQNAEKDEDPAPIPDEPGLPLSAESEPSDPPSVPLEDTEPASRQADQPKERSGRTLREWLPGARPMVIAMILLLGAVVVLAQMAFPIRRAVLGDFEASDLLGRLPFFGNQEADEDFKRWNPWLDCIGDSMDIIHDEGFLKPTPGPNETRPESPQEVDGVPPEGQEPPGNGDTETRLPIPGC